MIEVLIALYVKDNIIRPYGGDVIVIALIYTFILTFIEANKMRIAIFVLLYAFLIEYLQYLNIVDVLGLSDNKLMVIIIGTSFAWLDMLCYLIGFVITLLSERLYRIAFNKV